MAACIRVAVMKGFVCAAAPRHSALMRGVSDLWALACGS